MNRWYWAVAFILIALLGLLAACSFVAQTADETPAAQTEEAAAEPAETDVSVQADESELLCKDAVDKFDE